MSLSRATQGQGGSVYVQHEAVCVCLCVYSVCVCVCAHCVCVCVCVYCVCVCVLCVCVYCVCVCVCVAGLPEEQNTCSTQTQAAALLA